MMQIKQVGLTDQDLELISDALILKIGQIAKVQQMLSYPNARDAVTSEIVALQKLNSQICDKLGSKF